MASLYLRKGDATEPVGEGHKIIPHVTNDVGGWGSGFVVALSKKWKGPEQHYRRLAEHKHANLELGSIQIVDVEDHITVVNMCAQHSFGPGKNAFSIVIPPDETTPPDARHHAIHRPPLRYGALAECMLQVADEIEMRKAELEDHVSIHAPYFGSALAGGNWDVIQQMILEIWVDNDIDVHLYEFEPPPKPKMFSDESPYLRKSQDQTQASKEAVEDVTPHENDDPTLHIRLSDQAYERLCTKSDWNAMSPNELAADIIEQYLGLQPSAPPTS